MVTILSILLVMALGALARVIWCREQDFKIMGNLSRDLNQSNNSIHQIQNAFDHYVQTHQGAPNTAIYPMGTILIVGPENQLNPISSSPEASYGINVSGHFGSDLPLSGVMGSGLLLDIDPTQPDLQFSSGMILPPPAPPKGPTVPDLEDRWKRIAEEE
jgi:hypothetical protein